VAAGQPIAHASTGPKGPVLFALLAFLLAFAPLIRGGNRPMPLLVMEIAALLGLAAWAWGRPARQWRLAIPASAAWGIGLLLAAPLLQLVPLPASWWAAMPGHAPYAQVLGFAGDAAGAMRPASMHPRATEYSWLVMWPCLAVFVLTLAQSRSGIRRLVVIFVVVAVVQAILGILQLGVDPRSPLNFGNPWAAATASGTYVNKNHFAALMAMGLAMVVSLWALELVPRYGHPHRHHGHGEAHATEEPARAHPRLADRQLALNIVHAVAVLLLVVALLFSGSRAGIGAGLFAFSLASFALVWRPASVPARVAFGAAAVAALLFAAYIGLTPVLDRFATDQLALGYEGRMRISEAAMRAGLDFLPFGSGLGTFADVFRRYQVEGLPGFVDHAHNDYAELFLELGVAGIAAVALLLIAYAARWAQILRGWPLRSLGYLQVGAGLGMMAMLIHGAFDFNFHIPANALYFSFLAGVFLFTPHEDRA
jgi:O-antigen ligase